MGSKSRQRKLNTNENLRHRKLNRKSNKQFVKFLAQVKDPKIASYLLRHASDNTLTKSICNAAFNIAHGDIALPKRTRSKFAKNRKLIGSLISRTRSLASKRRLIQQGGAGLGVLIPILLSTVLGTLGSALFNKSSSSAGSSSSSSSS